MHGSDGNAQLVLEMMDDFVLRLGEALEGVRQADPDRFLEWSTQLPLTSEGVRRSRAIWLAHSMLPADVVRELPPPRSALFV